MLAFRSNLAAKHRHEPLLFILRLPGCEDIPLIGRYGSGGFCPGRRGRQRQLSLPRRSFGGMRLRPSGGWRPTHTHPGRSTTTTGSIASSAPASTGWHWTDNLKTEVDFGAGTEARVFRPEQVVIAGRTTYYTIESRFRTTDAWDQPAVSVLPQRLVPPALAAGANFTWERQTDELGPIYFYDDVTSRAASCLRSGATAPRTIADA